MGKAARQRRLKKDKERQRRRMAAAASGLSLLPVLAARSRAVDDAVGAMFGGSLTHGRGTRVTDTEGRYSGRAAADLATLHAHREVSSRSA